MQHTTLGTIFSKLKKFDCFGLFRSNSISPHHNGVVEPVPEHVPSGLPDDLIQQRPHKSSEEYMSDFESTDAVDSFGSSSTVSSIYWSNIRRTDKARRKELNQIDSIEHKRIPFTQ